LQAPFFRMGEKSVGRRCACVRGESIMKKNIILIGMPGVGKSTIGVILAKELGYRFIDSDLVIQEQEKRLLREIIEDEGVDGFLAIENRVNAELKAERSVIATGGSAVYGREAMEHFKQIGTVIYLHLPFEQLQKRLGNLKGRGVVLRKGQTLKDLFEERSPLYQRYADQVIDEEGKDIEGTLSEILNFCLQKDVDGLIL
jgi:shikimate kinase